MHMHMPAARAAQLQRQLQWMLQADALLVQMLLGVSHGQCCLKLAWQLLVAIILSQLWPAHIQVQLPQLMLLKLLPAAAAKTRSRQQVLQS